MKISDIKFRKSLESGNLKAIASLTIDGCIAVHELKVIETDHLFVAMPSRKDEFGNYHDIAHPIGGAARHELESAIIGAYKEYISAHETSEIENFTA
ncbi:putative stage V sporulation protein G [Eubacterium sp. CAG:786]|nr:putative stage V sporulation protein G [Eubacterium sp. CAG:786]